MEAEEKILDLLRTYQARNHLTDRKMAARLGIAPSSWSLFRRGKRSLPRFGIIAGFARLNPRKMGLLRAFLLGEDAAADSEDAA